MELKELANVDLMYGDVNISVSEKIFDAEQYDLNKTHKYFLVKASLAPDAGPLDTETVVSFSVESLEQLEKLASVFNEAVAKAKA